MIVTLTFDKSAEDYSEQEMMDTILGPKYSSVLWDIRQEIRQRLKHEELSEDTGAALEWMQERINDLAYDYGIILDQ